MWCFSTRKGMTNSCSHAGFILIWRKLFGFYLFIYFLKVIFMFKKGKVRYKCKYGLLYATASIQPITKIYIIKRFTNPRVNLSTTNLSTSGILYPELILSSPTGTAIASNSASLPVSLASRLNSVLNFWKSIKQNSFFNTPDILIFFKLTLCTTG